MIRVHCMKFGTYFETGPYDLTKLLDHRSWPDCYAWASARAMGYP